MPLRGGRWEDLVASGRITRPVDDQDIADEAPGDYGSDATRVLEAMRDLER